MHPILSDKHNWKHCSKTRKGPRWSTEKLLWEAQLLNMSNKNMWRLRHRREYCGIKILILAWLGLYLKVFVQKCYFMIFDAIGAFLMSFSAFLMLFCAFLTPFSTFLTPFTPFKRNFVPFCRETWFWRKFIEKNYRKPIYRPFQNYRANYRYRFNTSSNYPWF